MKTCPQCGSESFKVIYYGLPHLFCKDESCNCMFGFWANVTQYLPFNGWLMIYNGSYWKALFNWLADGWGQDDEY